MGKLAKIPAWQLTKLRNKKDVIAEARNQGGKVHFASLMDLCHLKNSELEPQCQKYKGRVVLQGDIVKDDSDSRAVLCRERVLPTTVPDTMWLVATTKRLLDTGADDARDDHE